MDRHRPGRGLSTAESEVLAMIDPVETVAALQELIRHRSDHPDGDIRAAVQSVAAILDAAGVDYEILACDADRPNLLATIPKQADSPRLVYHSHIDTVSAGNVEKWTSDPFVAEVKSGHVYGRGAGDDKASVAAQVMSIVTLTRAGVTLPGSLQVVVVADEETGGLAGTKWLRESGRLRPDYLVVGEQTNNQVAISERVACGIDLTIFGRSAHGATPWAGDNAILKACRALNWLQERIVPQLRARQHPYLPPPTLNIGRIKGGTQWNIVPDQCRIAMDRRLIPGETRSMAMREIRELLDEYAATVEPLQYELFSTGDVADNIDTDPDHWFVGVANAALTVVSGEGRKLSGYVQTSDGRWFAADGIPIIIFGPGDPALAHAPNERVAVDQLLEATRFLTLLALRWPDDE